MQLETGSLARLRVHLLFEGSNVAAVWRPDQPDCEGFGEKRHALLAEAGC